MRCQNLRAWWRTFYRLQEAAQAAEDRAAEAFIIAAGRLMKVGCSKHWPEAVPPKPNRFMAYIYTPFMKKVLYITERKRKSNVQHDCKSDDFRAGFEVAEWGVFCHSAWSQISPARFKQVYSDSAF